MEIRGAHPLMLLTKGEKALLTLDLTNYRNVRFEESDSPEIIEIYYLGSKKRILYSSFAGKSTFTAFLEHPYNGIVHPKVSLKANTGFFNRTSIEHVSSLDMLESKHRERIREHEPISRKLIYLAHREYSDLTQLLSQRIPIS